MHYYESFFYFRSTHLKQCIKILHRLTLPILYNTIQLQNNIDDAFTHYLKLLHRYFQREGTHPFKFDFFVFCYLNAVHTVYGLEIILRVF